MRKTAANAVEGFGRGVVEFGYDPETFGVSGGCCTARDSRRHTWWARSPPIIIDRESKEIFGDDGPKYWFGYASSPLVFQHENVTISIYSPTELQQDFSPEETHAHWPWDQFDAIRTDERNGGRWVFGRRARRFPPRTPCRPRSERRPGDKNPWPQGDWRKERLTETSEPLPAGYVALFSARGFKSFPAEMHWWEKQWHSFAHRELIADGDDNIFVTIVGDQSTYHSFEEFRADVLARHAQRRRQEAAVFDQDARAGERKGQFDEGRAFRGRLGRGRKGRRHVDRHEELAALRVSSFIRSRVSWRQRQGPGRVVSHHERNGAEKESRRLGRNVLEDRGDGTRVAVGCRADTRRST